MLCPRFVNVVHLIFNIYLCIFIISWISYINITIKKSGVDSFFLHEQMNPRSNSYNKTFFYRKVPLNSGRLIKKDILVSSYYIIGNNISQFQTFLSSFSVFFVDHLFKLVQSLGCSLWTLKYK